MKRLSSFLLASVAVLTRLVRDSEPPVFPERVWLTVVAATPRRREVKRRLDGSRPPDTSRFPPASQLIYKLFVCRIVFVLRLNYCPLKADESSSPPPPPPFIPPSRVNVDPPAAENSPPPASDRHMLFISTGGFRRCHGNARAQVGFDVGFIR